MRSLSLIPLLIATPFILVAAEQQAMCYPVIICDTDPVKMREAISLIPDPPLLAQESPRLDSGAYRVPAIFEASAAAQILVRVTTAFGLELDANALMTYLWPQAKQAAIWLFDKCNMGELKLSGRTNPTMRWAGPPFRELGFQIDMTCEINKSRLRGVATYTASGVESGSRIGGGRNITRFGEFGM